MTPARLKSFTWRITQIPSGTTKTELVDKFFAPQDRAHITVGSLCPDVDDDGEDGELTATILFRPHLERPDSGPEFDYCARDKLEIDKDFEGFTPLYCPPDGTQITADIIAITGLAGHAFGSWAHSEERMWLRDYLPKFANSARVLTYGYSSRIMGSHMSSTILADLSNAFLDNLINMRDVSNCDQRPIIFIGHSLGCLIIKKAMTSARHQHVDSSRLPVRCIIFFAAPHRGMNIDALRTIVKDDPPRQLVEELSPGHPTLEDLNERFSMIAQDIDILTCFEGRRTKTVAYDESSGKFTRSGPEIMMLEPHSAKQYWPKERTIRADADHSSIAKLKKGQGSIFQSVRAMIVRALTSTAQISRETPFECDDNNEMANHAPRETFEPNQLEYKSPYSYPYTPSGSYSGTAACSPASWGASPPRVMSSDDLSNGSPKPQIRSRGAGPPDGQIDIVTPPVSKDLNLASRSSSGNETGAVHPAPPYQSQQRPPLYAGLSPGLPTAPMGQGPSNTRGYDLATLGDPGPHQVSQRPSMANLREEQLIRGLEILNLRSPQQDAETQLSVPQPPLASSRSSEHLAPTPSQPNNSEFFAQCDECDQYINDLFHKCLQCPMWVLCQACFTKVESTHPKHEFQLMHLDELGDHCLAAVAEEPEKPPSGRCCLCDQLVSTLEPIYRCDSCFLESFDWFCGSCHARSQNGYCLKHGEPAVPHRFIWYGERLCTVPWINPKSEHQDSILVKAMKEGNMELLDQVVRDEHLVMLADQDGRTPLHIAVHLDLKFAVKFLVMHGAFLDARDRYRCTPLGQAILTKNTDMVRLLMERGASYDGVEMRGNSPLHLACLTGSIEMVELLLAAVELVDKPNGQGETPLFHACRYGEVAIAETLIQAGADVDAPMNNGESTILGELAAEDDMGMVHFLLSRGATLEAKDDLGRTPLLRAAANDNSDLCSMLIEFGASVESTTADGEETLLGCVASNGCTTTLNLLLSRGASVDAMDSMARTPLFRAAAENQLEVCQELLNWGADPNPGLAYTEQFPWTMTPLHMASLSGYVSIVNHLFQRGATVDGEDELGRTPLFLAAEYGLTEVCMCLLSAGANVNSLSYNNDSVVSIAAKYGHADVVELLITSGGSARPPPSVFGGKWKNFLFYENVDYNTQDEILALLRAYKHA